MVTVRLTGKVTPDRQLIIDIPDDLPVGDVQVILEVPEHLPTSNPATERARQKLAAAGALSTVWKAPADMTAPSEEEELIALIPGDLSIDEIVDEDRDER